MTWVINTGFMPWICPSARPKGLREGLSGPDMSIYNPQSAPLEVSLRIIISSLKLWEELYVKLGHAKLFFKLFSWFAV